MKPLIIIIDDELPDTDPLITRIVKEGYGFDKIARTPEDGIAVIKENIDKKIIVVLDYKFEGVAKNGSNVFDEIRKVSALIPVIVWTANSDRVEEYAELINKHAFSLLTKSTSKALIEKIKEAEQELDSRVEGAIEEWITLHGQQKRSEPYMVSAYGTEYSLDDILQEVRLQTELGKQFEKDILMLTIDRLLRGKEKLQ